MDVTLTVRIEPPTQRQFTMFCVTMHLLSFEKHKKWSQLITCKETWIKKWGNSFCQSRSHETAGKQPTLGQCTPDESENKASETTNSSERTASNDKVFKLDYTDKERAIILKAVIEAAKVTYDRWSTCQCIDKKEGFFSRYENSCDDYRTHERCG
eukprot:324771_1